MDLCVAQADLARALRLVARAVPARPATPALGHVLLDATPGRLTLTATDLALGLLAAIAADVARPGRATLPAGLLGDYAAHLPAGPVRLTGEPGRGRIRVQDGRAAAGFAAPDMATAVALDAAALGSALARVVPAAARDETRPILAAVRFALDAAGLTLAATDGVRLARARVPGPSVAPRDLLVPARAAAEMARLAGEAATARLVAPPGDRGLWLVAGAVGLCTRLVDGRYPDLAGLVPATWRTRVTVAGAALRGALRRADLFGREGAGARPVVLSAAAGRLRLGARDETLGETQSELAAELEGAPGLVALDTRLLVDLLAAARAERLALSWAGQADAVVVREVGAARPADDPAADDLWLVMPLREPDLLRRQADADTAAEAA
ncbi:MAG TPA: DNA polymerase III subunit beta [Thermomicrobiales bacterium]|nr:DNA polymerase III subunit beta [Thermomicrobiales bacterium]